MDKIKKQNKLLVLSAILIFSVSSVISLGLNIEVAEMADQRIAGLDYRESTNRIQEINFTIENSGSLGCRYQAKAIFNDSSGNVEEAWSGQEALWPGETANIGIKHVFNNETSRENADLYLHYCGVEEKIANFGFNVSSNKVDSSNIESVTLNIRNNSAKVLMGEPADEIVPLESPSLWKLSSSLVEDRSSQIDYHPPIFQSKVLEYYVVRDGAVIGTVKVDLSKPDGLKDKLEIFAQRIRLNL